MALRAQFRNSLLLIAIGLFSCHQEKVWVNLDHVPNKTEKGITYVNEKAFTGILFQTIEEDTTIIRSFHIGKPDGTWREFYRGGRLKEIRFFENGKKTGRYQSWWESGKLKADYHFEADEYEGLCEEWTEDGILVSRKNYHRGQEDGLQQMWTRDGKLWANYDARNGRQYGILGTKGCATLWKKDSVVAH